MRLLPVLLLALVLLAVPAGASAAVRHAVPAGGALSGACNAAAPCTLEQAIAGAAVDDTVRVAGGTYGFAAPLALSAGGIVVEGDPAGAPPLLQWTGSPNASAILLSAYGQTLRHLRVEGGVNGAEVLVRTTGTVGDATLDHVQVRNVGSGTGVAARTSLLRDSVVTSTGAGAIAAILTGTITSSTLVADGLGGNALLVSTGFFGGDAAATVRNTILRGAVSGWDAEVRDQDAVDGTTATLDVDFSSFGAGRLTGTGVDKEIVTGAANVTALSPLLAGLPGGADIHQLRGSPTIDAGTATATLGAQDIDGDPRVFGTATDIGADEYMPPPVVTLQGVVVGDTSAAITGLITPRGSTTSWKLEYGPTADYGTTAGGGDVPGTVESQPTSSTLSGLKPGTTYHVRVVGSSAKGTTAGPDLAFKTTTSPLGDTAGSRRPSITSASLARNRVRRGTVAGLRVRSTQAGTLEIVIARLQTGRRRGKACVAAKRCTAAVRVTALARKVLSGNNGPLPLVTTKLRRGRYRLTLSVVNGAGKRSKAVSRILRIR